MYLPTCHIYFHIDLEDQAITQKCWPYWVSTEWPNDKRAGPQFTLVFVFVLFYFYFYLFFVCLFSTPDSTLHQGGPVVRVCGHSSPQLCPISTNSNFLSIHWD